MATITYTFPNQVVPAGTLNIEVRAFSEDFPIDATEAQSEKYFSDNVRIVNETEYMAGELQSAYCDLTVDNDVDRLFSDTILPVFKTGGWVSVKVSLNGGILFIGNIEPTTIRIAPFHSDDLGLADSQNTVSFRCIWVLTLLKQIPTSDLYATLIVNKAKYGIVTLKRADGTETENLNSNLRFIPISGILNGVFDLFNSTFGYTVTYTVDESNAGILFGKDSGGATSSDYVYPFLNSSTGYPTNATIGSEVPVLRSCVVINNSAEDISGLWNPEDDKYIPTCYDWLVGILTATNTYPFTEWTGSYTANVSLSTRVSGSETTSAFQQLISAEEAPMSEISRDSIEVTSAVCGNSYQKVLRSRSSDNVYRSDVTFDFGGDEMTGNQHIDNSEYGLSMPVGGFWQVSFMGRALGVGGNLFSNPNFGDSLNDWTQDGFTASTASFNGTTMTCAESTFPVATPYLTKSFGFGIGFEDHLITKIWVKGTAGRTLNAVFKYYSYGIFGETLTQSETRTITLTSETAILYSIYRSKFRGGYQAAYGFPYISKVTIEFTQNSTNAIYVTNTAMYRQRATAPEAVGCFVEDFFAEKTLTRKTYTIDGIAYTAKLRDYIISGGENFYLKNITYDISKNETEIEAINYPY